jgi:putative membrane protein
MSWSIRAVTVATLSAGVVAMIATAAHAAAPSTQDTQYLQAAHEANLASITVGRLARQRGKSQSVRDVGAKLASDHSALDATVVQAAQSLGVLLPNAPSADQQAVIDRLQQASGAGFDSLFVTSEIDWHTKTLADAQTEISKGSDPTVIKVAADGAPVIRSDQQMLKAAAARLGIPTSVDSGTGGQAAPHRPYITIIALTAAGVALIGAGFRRRYARR